jgi:hypothetical protein
MEDPKQLVQRKIRQLVFLHVQYVNSQYGKIPVDQNKEYQRIYADWQAGHITMEDIQTDINEYLKMRENA